MNIQRNITIGIMGVLLSLPTVVQAGMQSKGTVVTMKDGARIVTNVTGAAKITVSTSVAGENETFGMEADGEFPSEPVTWLGVAVDKVFEEVAAHLPLDKGTGLIIEHVFKDSPAAKAGIKEYDVLTRLDDQILINPEQLETLISTKKDGDTIKLTGLRKGKEVKFEAKLVKKKLTAEEWGTMEGSGVIDLGEDFPLHFGKPSQRGGKTTFKMEFDDPNNPEVKKAMEKAVKQAAKEMRQEVEKMRKDAETMSGKRKKAALQEADELSKEADRILKEEIPDEESPDR